MENDKQIIPITRSRWKHRFLNKIAQSQDFPTRRRLFNLLKSFLNVDLILTSTSTGVKLMVDLNDFVQSQIYFYGDYETKSLVLFKQLALKSGIVFDIGSHIGQYSLEAANQKITDQKIYAVEANPKTFTLLLNNIQLNDFRQIVPILGAIAPQHGLAYMNIPDYWNMGSTSLSELKEENIHSYLISTFNFATLLKSQDIQDVELMKIDIEGHELGFFSTLFEQGIFPKNVIFEFIPNVFPKAIELVAVFRKNGYKLSDINGTEYRDEPTVPEQNLWAQRS